MNSKRRIGKMGRIRILLAVLVFAGMAGTAVQLGETT